MTKDEQCSYNAGMTKIVLELLDHAIDWPKAVEMMGELDALFGLTGKGDVHFNGDRVHDRREAQRELDWRKKKDLAKLGAFRMRLQP